MIPMKSIKKTFDSYKDPNKSFLFPLITSSTILICIWILKLSKISKTKASTTTWTPHIKPYFFTGVSLIEYLLVIFAPLYLSFLLRQSFLLGQIQWGNTSLWNYFSLRSTKLFMGLCQAEPFSAPSKIWYFNPLVKIYFRY